MRQTEAVNPATARDRKLRNLIQRDKEASDNRGIINENKTTASRKKKMNTNFYALCLRLQEQTHQKAK